MKKSYYYFLMMVLSILCSFFLYLSILTILARYRIIPLHLLDYTLGVLMSRPAYSIVFGIALLIGYVTAKKWWKIIYVDGVYYFDVSKRPKAPVIKRRVSKKEEE